MSSFRFRSVFPAVLCLSVVSLLLVAPPPVGAGTAAPRPGTVEWMAAQPVGTQVALDDLTVRDLTLDDPDPDTLVCGQTATLTAHLWDAEGYDMPGFGVTFHASNGEFAGGSSQVVVNTDETGTASVTLTPTTGDDVEVDVTTGSIHRSATIHVRT